MEEKKYDALAEETTTILLSGLTGLVRAGALFKDTRKFFKDEKKYEAWVDRHFGTTFHRWADRLIHLHERFKDETIQIRVFRVDVLMALADEDIPAEIFQKANETGKVLVGNEQKRTEDLSLADVHRLRTKPKKDTDSDETERKKLEAEKESLEESVMLRDKHIAELEKNLAEFREQMSETTSDAEKGRLEKHINQLKKELKELKKSKELQRTVTRFETRLQQVLASEERVSLEQMAPNLTKSQRQRLSDCIFEFEKKLKQFKSKVTHA